MLAKEYLKQIEVLNAKIDQKKKRAKEYREMALATGGFDYGKERVQSSNLGGQIEGRVLEYIALEQEIEEDKYNLELRKDAIVEEIHNLNNANHIKILFKRYVECKSLGVVAKELKYDYDYTRTMHGHALKEFEKINFTQNHTKECGNMAL